jgi:hypothetical protein
LFIRLAALVAALYVRAAAAPEQDLAGTAAAGPAVAARRARALALAATATAGHDRYRH